jgi:transposase
MYSLDVRKIIIKLYDKIKSLRYVEALTNVSKSTISRWKNSTLQKNKKENKNTPVIIDTINLIHSINPFYTILDIQKHLKNKLKIDCSYQLIRCIMKYEMNLSYKKIRYRNYLNNELLEKKIKLFRSEFKTLTINNPLIACIDEIGFNSNMNPIYSWSKKGKPNHIKNKLDVKNRQNKSTCTCITSTGNINYKTQNIPYNKISFIDFLSTLELPSNTIVLLDNVRFHHSKDVIKYANSREWILLFTPPYSPDFNPIENVFSCVKAHYKKYKNIDDAFLNLRSNIIIKCINHLISNIDIFYT